jgi:hypothetical protein
MKKVIHIFFEVLGVLFFGLIVIGVYVFVADPFNLKPLFTTNQPTTELGVTQDEQLNIQSDTQVTADKNSALSPEQEQRLESLGVDPARIPSAITPEQEACFIDTLGATRVKEIKAGSNPSPLEFFQARSCIE